VLCIVVGGKVGIPVEFVTSIIVGAVMLTFAPDVNVVSLLCTTD